MYASTLPREIRSSKLCVEINRKPEKNIPDIIDRNLNKDYQILTIFGRNFSDTTGYLKSALVSTSPNVCFCTTYGKQTKHNTC